MQVIHAFQEKKADLMKEHLTAWFGITPMELEDPTDGSYMACYCGAWLIPYQYDNDGEITVGAVWHQREYKAKRD